MTWKERAGQIKQGLPAVFLAMKHPGTPIAAKVLAAAAVAYALSPIDLIPDFIPVLGLVDDLLLLPMFIALAVRLIPHTVWEECLAQSAGVWTDGKPKKWYFAIPILLLWLMVLRFALRILWK